jgi:hypothetical protein
MDGKSDRGMSTTSPCSISKLLSSGLAETKPARKELGFSDEHSLISRNGQLSQGSTSSDESVDCSSSVTVGKRRSEAESIGSITQKRIKILEAMRAQDEDGDGFTKLLKEAADALDVARFAHTKACQAWDLANDGIRGMDERMKMAEEREKSAHHDFRNAQLRFEETGERYQIALKDLDDTRRECVRAKTAVSIRQSECLAASGKCLQAQGQLYDAAILAQRYEEDHGRFAPRPYSGEEGNEEESIRRTMLS